MFRTKKPDVAMTSSSRARPRSRSFSENPTDYLGLDDDVSAARQNHRPAQSAASSCSGGTRRTRSRSRGPKSKDSATNDRRGRSLSCGRRNNTCTSTCNSKGGSFLETLRRRSRSRSRPRNARRANNKEAGNGIDPNERWRSIVKTTGILSSQPNKQHDEINVRSENGFVGSRSGVDGRIVQGSRVLPAATAGKDGNTRQPRSNRQKQRQQWQITQKKKRTAVPKSQTEHIRPASSPSSSSRSKAAGGTGNRTNAMAESMPSSRLRNQPKPQQSAQPISHRRLPQRRHSFDGISDPRILDFDDELGVVEDCHEKYGDHHTVKTASVRTASSHERSRKSSLGHSSRFSAGSSRSSASVGRPRRVVPHPPPPPPHLPRDQAVPDASRSAPSKLMSLQTLTNGDASIRSRDSRASSRRSAPVVSRTRRDAGGPSQTVDSIRLRARHQQQETRRNRLKHSQQSMDDFRPPGLLVDDQSVPVQRQHANYIAPTKAANGDEGHLEALKDHEGPSGGTVPRPITRAASRGRGRGQRDYYQDNDDDDLMKRSHRSLGRSRSRSVGRRARKEQRRAERAERAERMMRRRASSMSRRCSSKDDVSDDDLCDGDEYYRSDSDRHQKEEAVVSSLEASNYSKDDSPRSTTKPWADAYLSLPGDDSSEDKRERQVAKSNPSSSAAPVDFSEDNTNWNEAATETVASSDDVNDLQKRLMRLAAGRNRRAESKSEHTKTRYPKQATSKHQENLQNSFASAVAIEDIDEDVFSSLHRHADNTRSPISMDQQRNQNAKSLHSSASTTEGALDGSLHFDGERIDYSGNEKYQSNHRCVLEDPFGLLDPDDVSSNSGQFKTADGWVKRNYEGGKAA